MLKLKNVFFLSPLFALILSCGGGGGGDDTPAPSGSPNGLASPTPTAAPVAVPRTLTISGKVVEESLTNASITIQLNGETFATGQSDNLGFYSIRVPFTGEEIVSLSDAMITVTAQGTGDRAFVFLTSTLGSLAAVLEQAGRDNELVSSENFATNVTSLTTAYTAKITESNGGLPVNSDEAWAYYKKRASVGALNLAAIIEMVIDNADSSTLSLPEEYENTLELAVGGAENESAYYSLTGAAVEEDESFFSDTIENLIADSDIVEPSNITFRPEGTYLLHEGMLHLREGGDGVFWSSASDPLSLDWTFDGDIVSIDFDGRGYPLTESRYWRLDSLRPLADGVFERNERHVVYEQVNFDGEGVFSVYEETFPASLREILTHQDIVDFDLVPTGEHFTDLALVLPLGYRGSFSGSYRQIEFFKGFFNNDYTGSASFPVSADEEVEVSFTWQVAVGEMFTGGALVSYLEVTFEPGEIFSEPLTLRYYQLDPYSPNRHSILYVVGEEAPSVNAQNTFSQGWRIDSDNLPLVERPQFFGVREQSNLIDPFVWSEFFADGSFFNIWVYQLEDGAPTPQSRYRPMVGSWSYENNTLDVTFVGPSLSRRADDDVPFYLCAPDVLIKESPCDREQWTSELIGHMFGRPVFYWDAKYWYGAQSSSVDYRFFGLDHLRRSDSRPFELPEILEEQLANPAPAPSFTPNPPTPTPTPTLTPTPTPLPPELALLGSWSLVQEAGALGAGPAVGDTTWWESSLEAVTGRDCQFDDVFTFDSNGNFTIDLGDETWLEPWQSSDISENSCGTPIEPHVSGEYLYSFDVSSMTLTLLGSGAYLVDAGVTNEGDFSDSEIAVPTSREYTVLSISHSEMTVAIDYGNGVWSFRLMKVADL